MPEIVKILSRQDDSQGEVASAVTSRSKEHLKAAMRSELDVDLLKYIFTTQLRHFYKTKKLAGKAMRKANSYDPATSGGQGPRGNNEELGIGEDEYRSGAESDYEDKNADEEEDDDVDEDELEDESAVFERDHFDKLAKDISAKGRRPAIAPLVSPAKRVGGAQGTEEGKEGNGNHFKTILKELEESVSEDDEAAEVASETEAGTENSQ